MSKRTAKVCLRLALGIALAGFLAGCIKPQLYRPQNIEAGDDFDVAYIEFDDHGEPWDPTQLERAIELIDRANREYDRIAVMLFVHGWQNNASPPEARKQENNVEGFKRLLEGAAEQLRTSEEIGENQKIIGVYLAWRGKSSSNKLIKPLTFYSRRGAGQRVASVSTTEAIVRVMNAAKTNPESVGIVVGHSFGGMIVERALAQVVIGMAINKNTEINPIADLVVLVNPASQSFEAKRMLSILERNRLKFYRTDSEGDRRKSPFIVSVTSTADTATGTLYPTALSIKGWTKRFREYGQGDCSPGATQKQYYKKTAGHNQILHSHVVLAEPLPDGGPDGGLRFELLVDEDTGDESYAFKGEEHRFLMRRLTDSYNDTPYWIMSAPPELIASHSDIFTYNTLQLLWALVKISGAASGPGHSVLVRENGVRPLMTFPLPEGGIAFLERSRRVFVFKHDAQRPRLLSCLPSVLDPDAAIGVMYEGTAVSVIRNGVETGKKKPETRTDVVTFDYTQPGSVDLTRITSDLVFTAAVGKPDTGEVYLAADGALYLANIDKKHPKAVQLSTFDEPQRISEMELDQPRNRIFAVDRANRAMYVIDLEEPAPAPRRIAADLAIPGEMIVTDDGKMLVLDTQSRAVMELDCSGGQGCDPPVPKIRHEGFDRPLTLSIGVNGTIWVGDAGAESIFAFDSDGKLLRTLDSIKGYSE